MGLLPKGLPHLVCDYSSLNLAFSFSGGSGGERGHRGKWRGSSGGGQGADGRPCSGHQEGKIDWIAIMAG